MKSLFVCSSLFSFLSISTTTTPDTITPSRSMRDGETLVSAGGSFQLGFFSPGASKGRYLGIWYSVDTETVVWVANRETPLGDSSGVLKVTEQGVLVLLNSTNRIVWSSNSSTTAGNPVSQLMDSGNLVLKDGNETNPDKFLWQSFDYPCDTFLPEMKLGWDLVTGLERYGSSWKSTDDPAPGEFSFRMDRRGFPQFVVMKGDQIMSRAGSWNGLYLTGYPYPQQRLTQPKFGYEFVFNKDEAYYEYRLQNTSMFSRYILNPSGTAQRFRWVYQTHNWELSSTFQADQCENYALCGAYTSCSVNVSPICACLKGFVPKSPKDWNSGYWSDGCVRKIPLACSSGDGFLNYTGVKLPDTSSSWYDKSMSLKECKGLCLNNCSCTAYANLDIREGGTGCLLWFGKLIDIREFTRGGGQDLYIRMASSELDQIEEKSKFNKKKPPGILLTSSALFLLGTLIIGLILYRRKKKLRSQVTSWEKVVLDLCTRSRETKVARLVYLLIGGIARGLLYLHQDSRLRIIHRDLKASDILLDNIMNPKISDFGLAKTFGSDQSQGNTKRVVGTYGYMSPEYAADGNFLVKSDVFSFGVILLEMLSRQKNRGFSNPDYHLNLLGHVITFGFFPIGWSVASHFSIVTVNK